MPVKSCSSIKNSGSNARKIRERLYQDKIYFKSLNQFSNSLSRLKSTDWSTIKQSSEMICVAKKSYYDQNKFEIFIKEDFNFNVYYYGWRGQAEYNILNSTSLQFLHFIEGLNICKGLPLDTECTELKLHVVTKKTEPFFSEKTQTQQREILAKR